MTPLRASMTMQSSLVKALVGGARRQLSHLQLTPNIAASVSTTQFSTPIYQRSLLNRIEQRVQQSKLLSTKPANNDVATEQPSTDATSSQTLGHIEKPRMAITFTCNVCETRATKTFTKHSYEKGVVIIRCDGCEKNHLIADNLGWFLDAAGKNIEDILAAKGVKVNRGEGVVQVDTASSPTSEV
eukprot:m.22466 g.22466  ORF g.22466 m.22466 type:complete len:185 (-) comp13830_c0_seq1:104-658(-)